MQADIEGAIRVARLAANFDWTWTVENVQRFYREAGWQSDSDPKSGAELRTGLMVSEPWGSAEYAAEFFRDYGIDGGEVKHFLVLVTDVVDDASLAGHRWLVDAFSELADRIEHEVGPSLGRVKVADPTMVWKLPKAVLFLSTDTDDAAIQMKIVNPAYQEWLDRLADEDEEDDSEQYAESAEAVVNGETPFPHTWPELKAALALTLSRLPIEGELVLIAPGGRTAWFTMGWDEFSCRVSTSGGRHATGKISAADRDYWVGMGWSRDPMKGDDGWQRSIQWPTRYREYEVIAEAAADALHDRLGVAQPSDLQMKAWIGESSSIPDITAFGID
jgi:hypothetical protein